MRWASAGHAHGAAEAGAGSACPRLVQHDCEGHAENHFVVHGGALGSSEPSPHSGLASPAAQRTAPKCPNGSFCATAFRATFCPTHAHGKLVATGQSPKPGTVPPRPPPLPALLPAPTA